MILVYLNLVTEWEIYKFAISGPKSRITRRFQQTVFLIHVWMCVYLYVLGILFGSWGSEAVLGERR